MEGICCTCLSMIFGYAVDTDCGANQELLRADSHANYDVVVTNVTLNPDPVIRGQDVTFIVPATASK